MMLEEVLDRLGCLPLSLRLQIHLLLPEARVLNRAKFCFQGLVVALVQFIEDFIEEKDHSHCCEAEICKNDDTDVDVDDGDAAKVDDGAATPNAHAADDDDDLSRLLSNIGQARRVSSNRDGPQPSIFDIDDDDDDMSSGGGKVCSAAKRLKVSVDKPPKNIGVSASEGASSAANAVPQLASVENVDNDKDVVAVPVAGDGDDEFCEEQLDLSIAPDPEIQMERRREMKQFRVNSPSYQAVQVSKVFLRIIKLGTLASLETLIITF